jgi:hypothetical protein
MDVRSSVHIATRRDVFVYARTHARTVLQDELASWCQSGEEGQRALPSASERWSRVHVHRAIQHDVPCLRLCVRFPCPSSSLVGLDAHEQTLLTDVESLAGWLAWVCSCPAWPSIDRRSGLAGEAPSLLIKEKKRNKAEIILSS